MLEGQPAAKAGIKTGDVITAVSGQKIDNTNELLRRIAALKPGDSTEMNLLRKGSPLTVSVTLGERDAKKLAQQGGTGEDGGDATAPAETQAKSIGLTLRAVTDREGKALGMDKARGVLVTEVEDGSEAEQSDVRPGDVVLEVNQRAVNTPEEFKKVVAEDGKAKGVVMLQIKRQRQTVFRTVPLSDSK